MKQVVAYLLYKHDEDSYTLQRVKIEKEAYQSMLSEYVCLSGNENDVLSRLPLVQYGEKTPFNLLFVDDEGIRVIPAQVEENFWDKYIEHDSMLPAYTRDEIIIDIDNLREHRLKIYLELEDALYVYSYLDDAFQDCTDFEEANRLRCIMESLNKAIDEDYAKFKDVKDKEALYEDIEL